MDPFRASEAVAAGETTWARLRGPGYVRLAADTWVAVGSEDDVRLRVRTLGTWSGGVGVVAGPLAALAWRADCPWDDAELVLPSPRRLAPPNTRVRTDRLHADEVTERFGIPVTTPARTAFDLARRAPLVEAVAAVDALAYRCHLTAEHLLEVADRHPGVRGSVQVRRVADLMDPGAMSPPETRLRLLFVLAGLPRPVTQYPVSLRSGFDIELDLGWPDPPPGRRPVGAEYDGPEHRTPRGQGKDHLRDGDLDDLDWDITRVAQVQLAVPRHAAKLVERFRRKLT
ncbi:hypothetical protein GCM10023201_57130 [Actinomycetospora corticicola]|uniref:AbiEi antitoxin C-terminal domain-containing protein n=1 Tax=Actinomycetospora corticicola TaxID=663602 RepID=A0A7Y9J3S3_9PSEU|nr:hypothetical protein [Actinomycetospora corticicola]NYD34372.1 hypothetical protein [Actinomycetospora corticicola]